MPQSLVATLPIQTGGAVRFFRSLMSALYEARAQRAREEIARHADLIASSSHSAHHPVTRGASSAAREGSAQVSVEPAWPLRGACVALASTS